MKKLIVITFILSIVLIFVLVKIDVFNAEIKPDKIKEYTIKDADLLIKFKDKSIKLPINTLPKSYDKDSFFAEEIPNLKSTLIYYRVITNGSSDFYSQFYFSNNKNEVDTSFNNIKCQINIKKEKTTINFSDKFEFKLDTADFMERLYREGGFKLFRVLMYAKDTDGNDVLSVSGDEFFEVYNTKDKVLNLAIKYIKNIEFDAYPVKALKNKKGKTALVYVIRKVESGTTLGYLYIFLEESNNNVIVKSATYKEDVPSKDSYPDTYDVLSGYKTERRN